MTSAEVTDDEAKLAALAEELCAGIDEHFGPWVRQTLVDRLPAAPTSQQLAAVDALLADEVPVLVSEVRVLLASDIDDQRSTPLAVMRQIAAPIANVLVDAAVTPPARDADAVRLHPDDLFDVGPASFGDVHTDLHLPGLSWGAGKAHVHLQRRRNEGRR